ncbi:flagellin [bacterium]|nr:flagellin [bacterium]
MGMRIRTNVPSLVAQRNLKNTSHRVNDNYRKLSTGERITRAADDAAGLAISEKMKSEIRGLKQAGRNANDAISLIQTAEGGLSEVSNIVIRLRELAIQAATDTIGEQERGFSNIEFQNLKEEIDRISQVMSFNGKKLLNGTGGVMEFQIGIFNDPSLDRLRFDSSSADATLDSLGLSAESIGSKEGAQISLERLDNALVKINGTRANLGAIQNRLTSTIQNIQVSDENLSAANSRIRDADFADETARLAKNNILLQAGTSVLSQTNSNPSIALKLLG